MPKSPRNRPIKPPETSPIGDAISPAKIDRVRRSLLDWFSANGRDLPWRKTRDPYRILVSEVMLQQTQVDRVIPYYAAFIERFPTPIELAEAPTSDVIKAWAGLGYNRRAVNLQRTARYLMSHANGEFPADVTALRQLPGIGPYTAGAIACFAFEQDAPFVDTNMRRVLHRVFIGADVPTPIVAERDLLQIAAAAVPVGEGWTWNQGLIEFGALQCTARRPACVVCPLQSDCAAFPTIQSALAVLAKHPPSRAEGPFIESNRYFRGRVVAALRALSDDAGPAGVALRDLGPQVRDGFNDTDVPWLYEVVRGLARDGLAVAEDVPPYDTTTDPAASPELGDVRIRLP